MSFQYSRDHCKIAVSKILQTIGWHTVNSTPLEVLTDLLSKYIQQVSKMSVDYANEFGQTEVNLDHLGLAFQEMGINLSELEEYVTYVNFVPGPQAAPKFPIPKENNLNFLKPGSKEVVTRPVHINEHLPPMYPLLEENEKEEQNVSVKEEITIEEIDVVDPQHFKKPTDFPPELRKIKKEEESSSRPTREISSVMMTTSGFLSPAREGKLPEAKAPAPPPPPEVPPPPVVPIIENVKKKTEKRKEKFGRELFKTDEKPTKKIPTMKDLVKMKQKSTAATPVLPQTVLPHAPLPTATTVTPLHHMPPQLSELKISPTANSHKMIKEKMDKIDKALAAAKAKTEKLNTTITPIPMKTQHSPIPSAVTIQQVEKLFNEPDKKKVNIFKKISREGKPKKDSRSATPNLMIDENMDIVNKINQLSSDITIEPIHPMQMMRHPGRSDAFFDSVSHRPSTPRMPDILNHNPTGRPEKRKRQRDPNRKVKSRKKNQHFLETSDFVDVVMDRPKTPESILSHLRQSQAQMGLPPLPPAHIPFPFLPNFGGPGLIPPQLASPMFPFPHFGSLPNFGKNPYFPTMPMNLSSQAEPVPLVSPRVKEPPPEYKPAEIIPQVARPPAHTTPKPPPTPPISAPPPRPATPVITPPVPPPTHPPTPPIQVPETSSSTTPTPTLPTPSTVQVDEDIKQKIKEHKKEKKDKIKKKNKKDKEKKDKSEKKKLKELKKDGKDKVKKEKKFKKVKEKDKVVKEEIVAENPIPKILLKVNSPSPRPETPETMKKLNIKPVVKRDDELPVEQNIIREPSPGGLAKIAALVTGPPKPKSNLSPAISPQEKIVVAEEPPVVVPPKTPGRPRLNPAKPKPLPKPKKLEQAFKKIDEQGNEVWICPACGQQDDGRPMIGCDGCDAWYHWVCVGIQVPPDENENWYCKPCLCKKNEDLQSDKKRKRKRKEKKEH